jgi:hypothetical protein
MLLGGPQNTIKSHLVFTALFCFAPFSVFFSRMSAPHSKHKIIKNVKCLFRVLIRTYITFLTNYNDLLYHFNAFKEKKQRFSPKK